jgi:hypothetical protein
LFSIKTKINFYQNLNLKTIATKKFLYYISLLIKKEKKREGGGERERERERDGKEIVLFFINNFFEK